MQASTEHPWGRRGFLNSYWAYSLGCGVTWAIIWAIRGRTASGEKQRNLLVYFWGWVAGWTSATIARLVYPPPKRRESAGPRSFFQGFRAN
jgi:hypothetical protein